MGHIEPAGAAGALTFDRFFGLFVFVMPGFMHALCRASTSLLEQLGEAMAGTSPAMTNLIAGVEEITRGPQ
jgi:hypothetical protein